MEEFAELNEYEERADFIKNEDLLNWTVESAFYKKIQQQIIGPGAKLIVGPRGTGKTHQFKFAYNKCLKESDFPLSIYVSFGKYYHLEPFLVQTPIAKTIFHTWVLTKILLGCYDLLSDLGKKDISVSDEPIFDKSKIIDFISQAEKGSNNDSFDDMISSINYHKVISILEELAEKLGRKRIILLLDDAALTLTPDYMVEFFDIFRSLKTAQIAPKATVYPGSTNYGPRFNLGHDASQIEVWLNVEDSDYSVFMDDLIQKRFSDVKNEIPDEIMEMLKYASFGIPRSFIGLIGDLKKVSGKTNQQKFNKVIEDRGRILEQDYLSLMQKIPQFKSILKIGMDLFYKIVELMVKENKNLNNEKQLLIGIEDESNINKQRMIDFLIEAGLLFKLAKVKHGDREYNRYIPHLLFLIKNRAFSTGKGFNGKKIVEFLKRESCKHPLRRSFSTLITDEQNKKIRLDLPNCTNCSAERLTEEQKFCQTCGKQLIVKSTFEACLKISIDKLAIPEWQKQRIKRETKYKTIGDILAAADPANELQKAYYIGPKKSDQIYSKVKAYVDEYLS